LITYTSSQESVQYDWDVVMASSFRDLRVWQEAMKLAVEIYRASGSFLKQEQFGLTQQIRRASVSVPSNIAEGKGRRTDKDFAHFLYHARGSLLELQTQLLLAHQLKYLSAQDSEKLMEQGSKVGRSLTGLINSMNQEQAA
jgi:four helix bundle protein